MTSSTAAFSTPLQTSTPIGMSVHNRTVRLLVAL
jgi:PPE-repeat protein